MLHLIRRWLGKTAEPARGRRKADRPPIALPALALRADATLPIVQWELMEAHAPAEDRPEQIEDYWTAVAAAWLQALGAAAGEGYAVRQSDHFLLLGALPESQAQSILSYAERCRKRILLLLAGIAKEDGHGKAAIVVLHDHETYYRYVSHYYPEQGEFSLSGGMFVQRGYGHFVFVADHMHVLEPTIAHELTHCMLQHLPLPAWINEGIAVNTEYRLAPPPGRPLHGPAEMHEKHLRFWSGRTIQEFWSGKSWLRPDEANSLSYDLARHFVAMAANDFEAFCRFVNAAQDFDSGDSAARTHLGYPVAHLAEAVLGEGSWQPQPETWKDGLERGQF